MEVNGGNIMSWIEVARKDFEDARRGNLLRGLAGAFLGIAFVIGSLPQIFGNPSIEEGVSALAGTMLILIPIVAILISCHSIVGERDSGSLHLLLSLPVERWEVLLGKIVGRTAVVFLPITLGFLMAIPFLYLVYGSFVLSDYAEFTLRALLNGALYTVIGVAVSASVSTVQRALAVVTGLFLTVYFVLYTIADVLHWLWYGEVPETPTTWMLFIERLPAHEALEIIIEVLFTMEFSMDEPLLLQEWVSAVVLLLWFVFPVVIGYSRFRSRDII